MGYDYVRFGRFRVLAFLFSGFVRSVFFRILFFVGFWVDGFFGATVVLVRLD